MRVRYTTLDGGYGTIEAEVIGVREHYDGTITIAGTANHELFEKRKFTDYVTQVVEYHIRGEEKSS